MSVDLLRRAAKLLRDYAGKAQHASGSLSPWVVDYGGDRRYPQRVTNAGAFLLAETFDGPGPDRESTEFAPLAEYMALVDWRVGLAVADWLESTAEAWERWPANLGDLTPDTLADAEAVARAVLRESKESE